MKALGRNVAKAICYCNSRPLMLGLGGAQLQLQGQSVETVAISEQYLAVQFDESLHKRTIAEIEKLAARRGRSDYGDPCAEAFSRSLVSGLRSLAIRS